MKRGAAALAVLLLPLGMKPAGAEAERMTFRFGADQTYLSAEELAEREIQIEGALYIDDYTGISSMRLALAAQQPLSLSQGRYAEPPFFAACGPDTQLNAAQSVFLWTGPETDNSVMDLGEVSNPGAPFLNFSVTVPRATGPGVYEVTLSDGHTVNSAGQIMYDTYVYAGDKKVDVPVKALEIVVEPRFSRGDTDGDGVIDIDDATRALAYYTAANVTGGEVSDSGAKEIFGVPYIHAAFDAAEASQDGVLDIDDASGILLWYTESSMGLTPDWDDIFN